MSDSVAVLNQAADIQATKLYFTGVFAILVYDYLLTFPGEVEHVWKPQKTFVSTLFLLSNLRICDSDIVFFICLDCNGQLSVLIPRDAANISCKHYAVTQFVHTIVAFTIAEVFLTLRAHVLTGKKKMLTTLLGVHILVQICLGVYVVSRGGNSRDILPPLNLMLQYQICMPFPKDNVAGLNIAYLCLALSFDILVFILTLTVTVSAVRTYPALRVMKVIQLGGIYYFVGIFTLTLIWAFFSMLAEPDLRMINAEPDMIFTALLINRLYLSLKDVGHNQMLAVTQRGHRQRMDSQTLQIIVSQQVSQQLL
ncbi:hypothetical protein C8J56DRAFT_1093588 [Mycena floridula]|nr:hypothetical protein C8J56DRAFT_1093588 [Mycena floridula]